MSDMRSGAKRAGLSAVTGIALLAAVIALAAWAGTGGRDNPAQANHQLVLGIDTVITGNEALALGQLEACRVLSSTSPFNVDIYLTGVDDIAAFDMYLRYKPSDIILNAPGDSSQNNNHLFMLQQAQTSNNFHNLSDTLPDSDGIYNLAGADFAVVEGFPDPYPSTGAHGEGVLVRLGLQGLSSFVNTAGKSTTLQITPFVIPELQQEVGPTITSSTGSIVGDYDGDVWVDNVVNATLVSAGGTCSDSDGDGVPDSSDNCPTVQNPNQLDSDGDGEGDACDIDDDNDGLVDTSEPSGCATNPDCDGDGVSDGTNDPDGGGPIVAGPDNCILTPNTDQLNTDGDSMGDACDPDDDNDTILDGADNCPKVANASQANFDGDSMGDACDPEDDGDGTSDAAELHIGTNPLDNCGEHSNTDPSYSQSYPADVYSESPSTNLVDVQDIVIYLVPIRILGTSPGDPNYNVRFDIVPGPGIFGADINVQDITELITIKPDMLGGPRAFGYTPACTP